MTSQMWPFRKLSASKQQIIWRKRRLSLQIAVMSVWMLITDAMNQPWGLYSTLLSLGHTQTHRVSGSLAADPLQCVWLLCNRATARPDFTHLIYVSVCFFFNTLLSCYLLPSVRFTWASSKLWFGRFHLPFYVDTLQSYLSLTFKTFKSNNFNLRLET